MKRFKILFALIALINLTGYKTVSAQQVLGDFTTADAFEWPRVTWLRDLDNNWDEGLIKMSSNTGGIARAGFGIHMNASRQFTFWSSGFNPLFSIEGGTGNTYIKGRVGIGTVNPSATLEIQQQASGWTTMSRVNAVNPGEINGFKFYSGYIGEDKWCGIASVAESIYSNKTGLALYTGMSEKVRISDNGNIGIGIIDANEKLVVSGNLKIILDEANFPSKNVASMVALGFSGITGAKNWALRSVYQYGNGVGNNADGGDLDVIKSLDGHTILATKTDGTALGNIGVGLTNPTERLTVNGKVKAKEIRVDGAGAPDYVFEEGYKIETLAALESYIKANKHLPEIPSAKEFERDGMAVGEMNKLLLKKIEELTLHLIEKDKALKVQLKINEDFETRLLKLERANK